MSLTKKTPRSSPESS
jgi:hypothetical protein